MQQLVVMRHGQRSMLGSIADKLDWVTSPRYFANAKDEPLTETGWRESYITGVQLPKLVDIHAYRYVYSSPMTRCMDTSVALINGIRDATGHILHIRVMYDLREVHGLNIMKRGIPSIDKHLKPRALMHKYSEYLDHTHDMLFMSFRGLSELEMYARFRHTIGECVRDSHSIICMHGGDTYRIFNAMLGQPSYDIDVSAISIYNNGQLRMRPTRLKYRTLVQ